jgi:DNA polymerase III delta prime subunit
MAIPKKANRKKSSIWADRYAPSDFENYIFQNDQQKKFFTRIVETKELPHLLLTGSPGSGKSTMAEMLVDLLEVDPGDVKVVNASDNNSTEYVRDEIVGFASTMPVGAYKIIRLEECDYLSINSQAILRGLIHADSSCRFICTANYEHKIIPALKSRFQHITFKSPARDDILIRAIQILSEEGVEFDVELLEKYVDSAYPDVRKIINNLQQNVVDKKLTTPNAEKQSDYKFDLIDMLAKSTFTDVRKLIISTVPIEEYEEVFRLLYQNIHRVPELAKDWAAEAAALVILNDAQYKHKIVGVPELNMDCCLANLGEHIKAMKK